RSAQLTITLVGGMQQNPCGAQAASLFFVNTTDWGTCAVGTSVPAADGAAVGGVGQGGATDVASQQTITAIGGMQQKPGGPQEASLLFVNTTDWGTCSVGTSVPSADRGAVVSGQGSTSE